MLYTKRFLMRIIAGGAIFTLAQGLWADRIESAATPDRAAKIHANPKPMFPSSLWKKGLRTGTATLILSIDPQGFLDDWLVIEASHKDLVPAIEEAVIQWTFEPAIVDGQNEFALLRMPIHFDITETSSKLYSEYNGSSPFIDNGITSGSNRLSKSPRHALLLARPEELDRNPQFVEQSQPLISPESMDRSLGTEATFIFYIDTRGRVRMPRLVGTTGAPTPEAIFAAAESLRNWRFEPLTSKRKPVVIEASQKFVFSHLLANR